MQKKLYLFVLFTLILFNGCTKYSFMSNEQKILGIWKYSLVTKANSFGFQKKDMTDNFKYYTLEFKNDGTVISKISATNQEHIATYQILENTYWNNDVQVTEYLLELEALMPNGTPPTAVNMQWTNVSITGKRLKATEEFNKENWSYTLERM